MTTLHAMYVITSTGALAFFVLGYLLRRAHAPAGLAPEILARETRATREALDEVTRTRDLLLDAKAQATALQRELQARTADGESGRAQLQARIGALEATLAREQDDVAAARQAAERLQLQVTELEAALGRARDGAETAHQDCVRQAQAVEAAQGQVHWMAAEADELRAELRQRADEAAAAQKERDRLVSRQKVLEARLEDAEARATQAERQQLRRAAGPSSIPPSDPLARTRQEVASLTARLESAQQQLAAMESQRGQWLAERDAALEAARKVGQEVRGTRAQLRDLEPRVKVAEALRLRVAELESLLLVAEVGREARAPLLDMSALQFRPAADQDDAAIARTLTELVKTAALRSVVLSDPRGSLVAAAGEPAVHEALATLAALGHALAARAFTQLSMAPVATLRVVDGRQLTWNCHRFSLAGRRLVLSTLGPGEPARLAPAVQALALQMGDVGPADGLAQAGA